ncbi:hypothetical protein SAMN02745121_00736 [Nannocystis exedens]|uniref:Uncharacterized protein n=2 Tax=Nannocystis exedens TaxID=54 RepID=A0A1I1TPH7_9BACT|nr:hypothetical protein SAMN02745121_00736 [Nannocystis exedens]
MSLQLVSLVTPTTAELRSTMSWPLPTQLKVDTVLTTLLSAMVEYVMWALALVKKLKAGCWAVGAPFSRMKLFSIRTSLLATCIAAPQRRIFERWTDTLHEEASMARAELMPLPSQIASWAHSEPPAHLTREPWPKRSLTPDRYSRLLRPSDTGVPRMSWPLISGTVALCLTIATTLFSGTARPPGGVVLAIRRMVTLAALSGTSVSLQNGSFSVRPVLAWQSILPPWT